MTLLLAPVLLTGTSSGRLFAEDAGAFLFTARATTLIESTAAVQHGRRLFRLPQGQIVLCVQEQAFAVPGADADSVVPAAGAVRRPDRDDLSPVSLWHAVAPLRGRDEMADL